MSADTIKHFQNQLLRPSKVLFTSKHDGLQYFAVPHLRSIIQPSLDGNTKRVSRIIVMRTYIRIANSCLNWNIHGVMRIFRAEEFTASEPMQSS